MIYAFIYILIGYLFSRTKLVTDTVDETSKKYNAKPTVILWMCIILICPIVIVEGIVKAFIIIIKRRKMR